MTASSVQEAAMGRETHSWCQLLGVSQGAGAPQQGKPARHNLRVAPAHCSWRKPTRRSGDPAQPQLNFNINSAPPRLSYAALSESSDLTQGTCQQMTGTCVIYHQHCVRVHPSARVTGA